LEEITRRRAQNIEEVTAGDVELDDSIVLPSPPNLQIDIRPRGDFRSRRKMEIELISPSTQGATY